MDFAELKSAWNTYDRKIQETNLIEDNVISGMIRGRSLSRVSWIGKMYILSFVCNSLWIILSTVTIVLNPFGFTYIWQQAPLLILNLSLVALLVTSIKAYSLMKSVDISSSNLDSSLKCIIDSFEKPFRFIQWNIVAILSSAFLLPLSFLPVTVKALGLWPGLILASASMLIVALVYFLGSKFGLFEIRYGTLFKEDLHELSALKTMSCELSEAETDAIRTK